MQTRRNDGKKKEKSMFEKGRKQRKTGCGGEETRKCKGQVHHVPELSFMLRKPWT